MAIFKLVKVFTTDLAVNRYSEPDLDLGKGPTKSMIKCSNGLPNQGIGQSGAGLMDSFGLPVT